ncbi:unnamed protein product [Dovyalis caffra]|uniref:BTB/POZ and MATH domain-containing protein 4 n=1 Tax=Dovyalis caffra TaxID=77055 RepID=A0AAV1R708_9ROSI|nr:unnamed protein product [Dovyalis caffra]
MTEANPLVSPTASQSVTETVNGSHKFEIQGYSLAKGMGVGKHIASDNFTVGGYQWAIYFYPDGKNPEDNSVYVSVFIALASEGANVRALFELTLVDQSGKEKHKVHSHFDRSLESGPYALKYRGSMCETFSQCSSDSIVPFEGTNLKGYKRFFRRATLETSDYLRDDCLKFNCTVGVVVSATDCSRLNSIQVPVSDIGAHFGMLLDNMEGSDVVFNVAGEKFHAHKLVLSARSPFFRSKFFDDVEEDEQEIVISDLEPKVFKAMLHFIYRDTLTEDVDMATPSFSPVSSVSETLTTKLLAAADRYGLDRLRLMCESHLCKDISVVSVASILASADSHRATELKAVCLKFTAENLADGAVQTQVDIGNCVGPGDRDDVLGKLQIDPYICNPIRKGKNKTNPNFFEIQSLKMTEPNPLVSPTASRSVTETVNGSHKFEIQGYSLAKGMGVGKHIASDNFTVGGYQWAIYFYPDGKNPEDNSAYVSVFIALASEGTDVRALFELTLVDQSGKGKHKVHSHFDRSLESGPYTLKYRGSMWGYKRFFRRVMLETSDYLKDDCLKINCTVGVVVSATDCSRLNSIQVPESDIGAHFGMLLDNMEEEDEQEIVISDLEPKVFKAMLHFIYRDTLTEDVDMATPSSSPVSSPVSSVPETLTTKLLAAADRYGLDRLRLMCESHLCKDISVDSVASILALADSHHAIELKAVCLKFAAENLAAVMRTDGFTYLKENCPLLQSELLKTVAGCEEDCSSGGGKSRSVWAQLSDGGDTNGRRVRQRS